MSATMKAAIFVERGRIELAQKPVPDVGPTDALVRIDNDHRLGIAKRMGADVTLNYNHCDV